PRLARGAINYVGSTVGVDAPRDKGECDEDRPNAVVVGGILLLPLLAPFGAAARPPQPGLSAPLLASSLVPSPSFAGAHLTTCSSGAHSLSPFGAHVYPETGNGGYTSVHTDVFLNYDTASNVFLLGTHVVLADRATQCLTDFSLDFERTSPNTKAPSVRQTSS